jgi:hypothetical protein
MQYAYKAILQYFFATAVLISTKLYGNHRYKKAIYISLACPDITILHRVMALLLP